MRALGLVCLSLVLLAATAWAEVDVDLQGLDNPLRDNVMATLSIGRAVEGAPAGRIRRLHARAPDEIRTALQPFGYYDPQITASLEQDGETWHARYVVAAGPRVQVGSVDVRVLGPGGDDPGFLAVAAAYPQAAGDPLDHAAHELGKRRLLEYAARHGYFAAAFDTAAILVSVPEQRAEVIVHLDSGPRYLFGPVALHQDVLEERMVAGYVTVEPGQPYDVAPLLRMQSDLSTGPWFSAVEIHTRSEQADSLRVPVDVDLYAARSQRWELGLGYGTDTGVRGKIKSQWRRLNRRGHHAEAELQASAIEYSATGQYFIPWPYPRTELLTLFAGIGLFEPDWSSSWRLATGTSFARSRGSWREVFSLAYEHEDFTIASQDGVSELVIPGGSWTRTRADDPIIPSRGSRTRLDLRGASDAVLSSVSFVQLRAETKLIRSLGRRVRLIGRGTAARTFTDRFEALPPTQRFVTGGDQTVRGYGYESLGPVDANGEIVGGNSLAILSGELEYRFLPSWGMATFVDSGNALDDFTGQLAVGAGVGVRWFSPIGIVRLDGALGLSEDGNPLRIHLAIGPDL